MKTRTNFKLSGKGVIHCWCGSISDFVEDINEFIIPILEDDIIAEFNYREVSINKYDDVNTIRQKFMGVLR